MTPIIRNQTVGTMCTFPGRFGFVGDVIASAARQVDHLFVYVNETTEGFPDISALDNVTVLDGRDHAGDMSANGKIYPLDMMQDCLVFVFDDDFIFPPDYVSRYKALFDLFDNKCCVTTHGSILLPQTDWYYNRASVFLSIRHQRHMQMVNLCGSGTFAFHQSTLPCRTDDFLPDVMVDLQFSILARDAGLPIWCLPRREGWLTNIKSEGLWSVFSVGIITHHTDHARRHDWSFQTYRDIANRAMDGVDDAAGLAAFRASLDPDLRAGFQTGEVPMAWRPGLLRYTKELDFLNILNTPDDETADLQTTQDEDS